MKNNDESRRSFEELNSDPTEGKSHPVGKAVGGLAGAAAGAAAGAVAGPVGAIGGAAIGGIAGWLEGKTLAEAINPDVETSYWKDNYLKSSYYDENRDWNDYDSAYKMGVYSYDPTKNFDDVEPELSKDWDSTKGTSRLSWKEASKASRDAYNRLNNNRN